ncbi:glycogen debranching protein GlgX [Frankia tisae]|uniref:glycogen debranching protein GlgX n=1 Tax=Frankia tisae TaxID=2950104 RepID=UPI0021BFD5E6|nr:glycogen debranching protein GlgX [Frankia tisae]
MTESLIGATVSGKVATSALGVHLSGDGVDVGVSSGVADAVDFCLFDDEGGEQRLPLERDESGTWRGHVAGVQDGDRYGFRVSGPWNPASGLRCNPAKLLSDPYARAVTGTVRWGSEVLGHVPGGPDRRSDTDSAGFVPRSVVVAPAEPPAPGPGRVPWSDTVLYETHVKGFTQRHPDVPAPLRGTYAGLGSPAAIDHLLRLGVTTVELMPVHHFPQSGFLLDKNLRNYWGYDSISYFAPHGDYAAARIPGEQVAEFRTMVGMLHTAGLEVLLDVVFNHTAEGNENGPTLCYRGLDNGAYYRLVPGQPRFYYDTTGTGNTLDLAHPTTLRLVLDALRYWVTAMGVDGFRFDLAASLARDEAGGWDVYSAFLDAIAQDPVLSAVKLVAEPWDTGFDGYDVGRFPAGWSEWNGRYRDDVRDFWRGADGKVPTLATRLAGSSDLYPTRGPLASINFITCHDGFTLRDLTSYNTKHNEPNGEGNRDGTDDNRSWNCGAEGDTDDPAILALRARQQRNLLTTLLVSDGVPMLGHGDELGRTQHGNNNAYCQDNDGSWIDWDAAAGHTDLTAFTAGLIRLRHQHPVLRARRFPTSTPPAAGGVAETWLRPDGQPMSGDDWQATFAHTLAVHLRGGDDTSELLLAFNAYWEPVTFTLPGTGWAVVLDTTAADPPHPTPTNTAGPTIDAGPRSVVILSRSTS